MAYKYNGKLKGELDPWQQPDAFNDEAPTANPPRHPSHPTRPNVPHTPNIHWDARHGQWIVRAREGNKSTFTRMFPADQYEAAIQCRITVLGPIPEPRPTEHPNVPHVPGVMWNKNQRAWVVRIKIRGQRIYLGSFAPNDYDNAVKAVQDARAKHFPNGHVTQLKPCGTHAAYQRHVNRGEPICDPCRRAEHEYVETHRKRNAA